MDFLNNTHLELGNQIPPNEFNQLPYDTVALVVEYTCVQGKFRNIIHERSGVSIDDINKTYLQDLITNIESEFTNSLSTWHKNQVLELIRNENRITPEYLNMLKQDILNYNLSTVITGIYFVCNLTFNNGASYNECLVEINGEKLIYYNDDSGVIASIRNSLISNALSKISHSEDNLTDIYDSLFKNLLLRYDSRDLRDGFLMTDITKQKLFDIEKYYLYSLISMTK